MNTEYTLERSSSTVNTVEAFRFTKTAESSRENLQTIKSKARATKYIQMAMSISACTRKIKSMARECSIGSTCPDPNANIIEEAGGPVCHQAKAFISEQMVSLTINSGDIYHG
jgi:hypothetical protein